MPPWGSTTPSGDSEVMLVIRREKDGWYYPWLSSRMKRVSIMYELSSLWVTLDIMLTWVESSEVNFAAWFLFNCDFQEGFGFRSRFKLVKPRTVQTGEAWLLGLHVLLAFNSLDRSSVWINFVLMICKLCPGEGFLTICKLGPNMAGPRHNFDIFRTSPSFRQKRIKHL